MYRLVIIMRNISENTHRSIYYLDSNIIWPEGFQEFFPIWTWGWTGSLCWYTTPGVESIHSVTWLLTLQCIHVHETKRIPELPIPSTIWLLQWDTTGLSLALCITGTGVLTEHCQPIAAPLSLVCPNEKLMTRFTSSSLSIRMRPIKWRLIGHRCAPLSGGLNHSLAGQPLLLKGVKMKKWGG